MLDNLNLAYERSTSKSYLIIDERIELQNYQLRMMTQNRIPNLLAIKQEIHNSQSKLYYDITSKQKLTHLLERKALSSKELKTFISGVINIHKQSKAYLLNENNIILDPKYIYIHAANFEPCFMYIPINEDNQDAIEQTTELITYLFDKVDTKDMEAVMLIHNLYNLMKQEDFNYEEIENILFLNTKPYATPYTLIEEPYYNEVIEKKKETKGNKDVHTEEKEEILTYPLKNKLYVGITQGIIIIIILFMQSVGLLHDEYTNKLSMKYLLAALLILASIDILICRKLLCEKEKVSKIIKQTKYISNKSPRFTPEEKPNRIPYNELYNEITVSHETTLLNNDSEIQSYDVCLIHKASEKPMKIHKTPFIIGKMDKEVDYVIKNVSVSRIHAKIVFQNNIFYIVDVNSRNGTYLDGTCIKSNQLHELKHNSLIAFSNEEYIFRRDEIGDNNIELRGI